MEKTETQALLRAFTYGEIGKQSFAAMLSCSVTGLKITSLCALVDVLSSNYCHCKPKCDTTLENLYFFAYKVHNLLKYCIYLPHRIESTAVELVDSSTLPR